MEYISKDSSGVHLQIEVHAEPQLRADRSTWPGEKNTQNHAKLSRMKELGGETGVLVTLDLSSAGGGTEAGVWSPHCGNWVRQETFKADSERADLWQPKWNESDSPCQSHTYPGQGPRSPGRCNGWQLDFRDCGTISGRGLMLTAERWLVGMWGGDRGGKSPWRKARQPWKQGDTAESHVEGWSQQPSLSPTCQHWQLNKIEASLSNTWCNELQSRTPARAPPHLCFWVAQQQRRTPGKRDL